MSSYYYIFVVAIIAFSGYFYYIGIRGNSRWKKQNEHARVSEISKRLRWDIVEGDPELNLVVPNRFSPFAPKEVNVIMRGTTYGHPMELIYHDKRWKEQTLLGTKLYHEFDGRVILKADKTLPPIEIYSKNPGIGNNIESHLKLPAQTFGDAMLDDMFVLEAVDPSMGPLLAPHLGALLAIGFVHIIIDGEQIILEMTEVGMMTAMGQVDQWVYTMETIACVLMDKPIPGQLSFQDEASPSQQEPAPELEQNISEPSEAKGSAS